MYVPDAFIRDIYSHSRSTWSVYFFILWFFFFLFFILHIERVRWLVCVYVYISPRAKRSRAGPVGLCQPPFQMHTYIYIGSTEWRWTRSNSLSPFATIHYLYSQSLFIFISYFSLTSYDPAALIHLIWSRSDE